MHMCLSVCLPVQLVSLSMIKQWRTKNREKMVGYCPSVCTGTVSGIYSMSYIRYKYRVQVPGTTNTSSTSTTSTTSILYPVSCILYP